MKNNFEIEPPVRKNKISNIDPEVLTDKTGKISETIGTGNIAKDSIIYLVIKWSFITGAALTLIVVLDNWCFSKNDSIPDLINDVKVTWSILIPLITLSLGYAFGKSK